MHRIVLERPEEDAVGSGGDPSWQFSPDSYTDFYGQLHHDHLAAAGGSDGGGGSGVREEAHDHVNSWIHGDQEPLPRDVFRPVEVPAVSKGQRGERRSSLTLLLKGSSTEPGTTSSNEVSPRSHDPAAVATVVGGGVAGGGDESPTTTAELPPSALKRPHPRDAPGGHGRHTDGPESADDPTNGHGLVHGHSAGHGQASDTWVKILATVSSDSEDSTSSDEDDDDEADGAAGGRARSNGRGGGGLGSALAGFKAMLRMGSDVDVDAGAGGGKLTCLNFDRSPTKSVAQKMREKALDKRHRKDGKHRGQGQGQGLGYGESSPGRLGKPPHHNGAKLV